MLHDCSSIAEMPCGEVAVIIEGGHGHSEMIACVLHETRCAGIVMLGTESVGGAERWYTPASAGEFHALMAQRAAHAASPLTATGVDLDRLAGASRAPGETDQEVRQRIMRDLALDDEIDGWKLQTLLDADECTRRETGPGRPRCYFTPAQSAAVSAHWSAQLRAKVAASAEADKERERNQVVLEHDVDDQPWRTW
jgi:hypothetical protein